MPAMQVPNFKKVQNYATVGDSVDFIASLLALILASYLFVYYCMSKDYGINHSEATQVVEVSSENQTQKPEAKDLESTDTQQKAQKTVNSKINDLIKYKKARILANSKGSGLSPKVLNYALTAYYNAKDDKHIKNQKLTVIDYSVASSKRRMWLINMKKEQVIMNLHVSHGSKSGYKYARRFSNRVSSHQSSIGVMKTGKIYYGKNGISLHLHGLEPKINSNVYKRHVVIHGSKYVNERWARTRGRVGRSLGCPAVSHKYAKKLINNIANGSLVFAYYPMKSWLSNSAYL